MADPITLGSALMAFGPPLLNILAQAGPALGDLFSGRTRQIAEQQGRPYSPLDVFLGTPQTREPYMAQGSQMYGNLLSTLGPFAQQLLVASPQAFSPMYDAAMQQLESETAPRIQQMFGSGQEKYTGGFDAAMAQAARMLQKDLAAQQAERQMGLANTLLGSLASMRQVGEGQAARPGLLQNLLTPGAGGQSPIMDLLSAGQQFFGQTTGQKAAQQARPAAPAPSQLDFMRSVMPRNPQVSAQQLFGPSARPVPGSTF